MMFVFVWFWPSSIRAARWTGSAEPPGNSAADNELARRSRHLTLLKKKNRSIFVWNSFDRFTSRRPTNVKSNWRISFWIRRFFSTGNFCLPSNSFLEMIDYCSWHCYSSSLVLFHLLSSNFLRRRRKNTFVLIFHRKLFLNEPGTSFLQFFSNDLPNVVNCSLFVPRRRLFTVLPIPVRCKILNVIRTSCKRPRRSWAKLSS